MQTIYEYLQQAERLDQEYPMIHCGLSDLNGILRRGMLSVLAGRADMDLSALAAQIAGNIAQTGQAAAYFSPSGCVINALDHMFWEKCPPDLPLYVDTRTCDVEEMCASVRDCPELPAVMVVENLPETYLVSRKNRTYTDLREAYARLKSFAQTAHIAVLCIAPIRKYYDQKQWPKLSDIVHWPQLDGSADTVCALLCPGDHEQTENIRWEDKCQRAELHILRSAGENNKGAYKVFRCAGLFRPWRW